MPYIKHEDKKRFITILDTLQQTVNSGGISNGDLNYLMTCLAKMYLSKHGESYNTLSDVVKAFECAKLEFYRRKVAPYEDRKIKENGDVWGIEPFEPSKG
jgi:hypothetical protein